MMKMDQCKRQKRGIFLLPRLTMKEGWICEDVLSCKRVPEARTSGKDV
jgi:hypothetical protein